MKQFIYPLLLFFVGLMRFISANASVCNIHENIASDLALSTDSIQYFPDTLTNLDYIFQDSKQNYWLASNAFGVYKYDGINISHYTSANGLPSNYVWKIQEDDKGLIWFETRDGICSFNGKVFTDRTQDIKNAPYKELSYMKGGVFFNHLGGICLYRNDSFFNFVIHSPAEKPLASNLYRPYGVYVFYADKKSKVWMGTQEKGGAMFDGDELRFFTEKDLAGPAVRCILEDSKGRFWFGNNGGGLFCLEGNNLRNITQENHLGNDAFLYQKKLVDNPGSMARVFTLAEDLEGNIWIGTADAGVWKYSDGELKHYTLKDGLCHLSVTHIFKSNKGELWFVCGGNQILRMKNNRFEPIH